MLSSLEDLRCFVTEEVFELAALERGLTVVLDISCNSSYFIVAMPETVFNIRLYCYVFFSVKDSCSGD